MNKTILLVAVGAVSFLTGIALAASVDHHCGVTEVHPDAKIFRWGENRAGDCHQVGATLTIRRNGTASFTSQVWTHTHGTDYWHSNLELRGPGGNLGVSGLHNSPGMPHNHDGPGNLYPLNYDFNFPAANFDSVSEAVEHSAC